MQVFMLAMIVHWWNKRMSCPILVDHNKTIHIRAHTTLGEGIIPTFYGRINQQIQWKTQHLNQVILWVFKQVTTYPCSRGQGQLPSDTEKTPKEQAKEITLRSGKKILAPKNDANKHVEESKDSKFEVKDEEQKSGSDVPKRRVSFNLREYKPPVPLPKRLLKNNMDKKSEKFLEVFKKLYINIPLLDAVS